ncbi:MAG: glucose-1-phosphate adenylyltransferase subunit GlgD [Clostridiales Family XIII bacterium]|jgi:glucose-1-phosphate adenylyltransferase|nr:glucose-1-phosphate adenylyltransferase subunit GlgD [Clostridiales Family XIII bacterium]
MYREAFGLIYAGEDAAALRELVDQRTVGALPIGGKYRVIDFPLSNMVNSDIRKVGVITSRNYNSLMDHLSSGKAWDLSRKSDGLFIFTPYSLRETPGVFRGKVEALKSCMGYIRRAKQEYCVMTETSFVFNINFDEMMRSHCESGADLTILYHKAEPVHGDGDQFHEVFLDVGEDGRVRGIEVDPMLPTLSARSMKTYIVRKDVLIYLVDDSFAKGEFKFSENLLRNNIDRIKMMAFEHKGYVGTMRSVASYFRVNMDLLDPKIRGELFTSKNRIYTKVKDSVPAKYTKSAAVKNSLVANGCIIEGRVENSVLFRDVHVGKDAVIRNSIILANTDVAEEADLEYAILDKNVNVRQRRRLVGNSEFPMVIRKGGLV